MGFVKTREEVARIQATLAEPHFFSAQMLTIQYLTKPEIIRHVLPPGLQPTDQPLVTAMVGRWGRSNCVHAFAGGALYVQAKHKDYVGDYCLAMPMSTDVAIIFGRELFGEPKKQARVKLHSDGNAMRGTIERWVILQGEAKVEIGGERFNVRPLDVVHIAPEVTQRLTNTGSGDLIFLAICTPRFRPENYQLLEP